MAKFRLRNIEVSATQYTGPAPSKPDPRYMQDVPPGEIYTAFNEPDPAVFVNVTSGECVQLDLGDWVVHGPRPGEVTVLRDAEFRTYYEEVQ